MRALNEKHSYDHKTKQQNPLTEQKNLLGHNRYYGVMVSNLDAESKDSKLNFSGIFAKNFLFVDIDYSWQIWLRGKPLNQKSQWREQLSKKVFNGNRTHEQNQLTQQKYLSDHNRFYD